MLTALQGQPILTITDDRLGPQRGIVHFILKDGRVRFPIDDTLAARRHLTISAQLLSLAVSDRKSVVSGQSVSVRVDLGGRRIIKKTKNTNTTKTKETNRT